jgi:hypothetical protein
MHCNRSHEMAGTAAESSLSVVRFPLAVGTLGVYHFPLSAFRFPLLRPSLTLPARLPLSALAPVVLSVAYASGSFAALFSPRPPVPAAFPALDS